MIADAALEGQATSPEKAHPYHGYLFRMLAPEGPVEPGRAGESAAQAGFAAVAWPAAYGRTGIMTFVVNESAVVLEKDLGADTLRRATEMKAFADSSGWAVSRS